jgi:hypothetical protein
MSYRTHTLPRIAAAILITGSTLFSSAQAVQFSYLDPAYEQDIYTGVLPTGWGPGYAWSDGGNMVLRGNGTLYEYSLTDDTVYNGTDVHSYTTHAIAGLSSGYGMTNGTDGFVYANTTSGVQQINLDTWAVTETFVGSAAGYYGIATLPDGRIVHNDSQSQIWVLDPTTGIDTMIFDHVTFVDDIAVSPTGEIFLAGLDGSPDITVISDTGTLINVVSVTHSPDGMAFGDGAVFANNTDGTITRIDFAGAGYTGAGTEVIFASGGTYGDLAAVGPDGSFYVSQWGSIHWGDSETTSTTNSQTVVRISLIGGGGFDPSPGTGPEPTTGVPEPGTNLLLAMGMLGLWFGRKNLVK